MTSKYIPLPREEQVSDSFGLYYDGKYYYAVRSAEEGDMPAFVCKDKSKWIAISDAVETIHQYIWNAPPATAKTPYWDNELQKVLWQ